MTDPRVALQAHVPAADADTVLHALDAIRPVIYIPPGSTPAAARAAAALYSMLRRLHPHTVIEGDALVGPNPWGVASLAALPTAVSGALPTATRGHEQDVAIAVGDRPGGAQLYIGGGDWTARLGRSPQVVESGRIGLGLHAAATLAAAELMKQILGPLGMASYELGQALEWNLIDYQLRPPQIQPDRFGGDAGLVVLFGAGSVGSSTGGVLACVSDVWGRAIVVDPDSFDPARNPIRYPAATTATSGLKAPWVAAMLHQAGWRADPFPGRVAEWVALQSYPGLDGLAVSSVDDVGGRLDVADVIARTTLSLGVAGLSVRMVRTEAAEEGACPYCEYANTAQPLSQAAVFAGQTGLTEARVAALILTGETLTAEDVATALAAEKIRVADEADLVGRRFQDLVLRTYAQVSVAPNGQGQVNVSAPYVSWMAGVLGAAEIVKRALALPTLDRRIDFDMTGLPQGFVQPTERDATRRCICWSSSRREWATRLYA